MEWRDPVLHIGIIPAGTTIAPWESIIVLEIGPGVLGGVPAGTQQFPVISPLISITNGAFSVCLFDSEGIQIDEVRVSSTAGALPTSACDGPWSGLVDRSGTISTNSVERIWGLDSDRGTDWTVNEVPTPGKENTNCGSRGTDVPPIFLQ